MKHKLKFTLTSLSLTTIALPVALVACAKMPTLNKEIDLSIFKKSLVAQTTTSLPGVQFKAASIATGTYFDPIKIGISYMLPSTIIGKMAKTIGSSVVSYSIEEANNPGNRISFDVEFKDSSYDASLISRVRTALLGTGGSAMTIWGSNFRTKVYNNVDVTPSFFRDELGIILNATQAALFNTNAADLVVKATKATDTNVITFNYHTQSGLALSNETNVTYTSSTLETTKLTSIRTILSAAKTSTLTQSAFNALELSDTEVTSANAATLLGISSLPQDLKDNGFVVKATKLKDDLKVVYTLVFDGGITPSSSLTVTFTNFA